MYSSSAGSMARPLRFEVSHLSTHHAVEGAREAATWERTRRDAAGSMGASANVANARVRRASPARMAVASPNFLCRLAAAPQVVVIEPGRSS